MRIALRADRLREVAPDLLRAEQLKIIDTFTQIRGGKPVHVGRHIRRQRIADAQAKVAQQQQRAAAEVAEEKLRQVRAAEEGQDVIVAATEEPASGEEGRRLAFQAMIERSRLARQERVAKVNAMFLRGVFEFGHPDLPRYAVMLPDASQPGRWRASYFDPAGFSGHVTRDTPAQVLEELAANGYDADRTGALDALSGTTEWADGVAHARLNQIVGGIKNKAGHAVWRAVQEHLAKHGDVQATLAIVEQSVPVLERGEVPEELAKALAAEWARWHGGTQPPPPFWTAAAARPT